MTSVTNITKNEQYTSILYKMLRIRMIEEEIARRYSEGRMRCPIHLSSAKEGITTFKPGICAKHDCKLWQ